MNTSGIHRVNSLKIVQNYIQDTKVLQSLFSCRPLSTFIWTFKTVRFSILALLVSGNNVSNCLSNNDKLSSVTDGENICSKQNCNYRRAYCQCASVFSFHPQITSQRTERRWPCREWGRSSMRCSSSTTPRNRSANTWILESEYREKMLTLLFCSVGQIPRRVGCCRPGPPPLQRGQRRQVFNDRSDRQGHGPNIFKDTKP